MAEDGSSEPILISSPNEIGKLGTAFNRMLSSLNTQRELRRRLIADVSHEINTPLNSIRLEARGLTDGLVTAEEAGQHIISEIDTLGNIIYDLDWIAQTDSGEFELKKEKYQLSVLVDREISRWKHKAEAYGLHLLKQPPAEALPAVMIDVIRMTAVLGNLIDNAVKYSPEGSVITVSSAIFFPEV